MVARSPSRVPKSERPEPLKYKDRHQVQLDVARVALTKAATAKLEKRVATVLSAYPQLNYYQGFHDIAVHCHSTKQLENLALQQLRDFMAPSMQPTISILKLIPELLVAVDLKGLGKHFVIETAGKKKQPSVLPEQSRRMMGYFAIAPIVTLFSHDCDDSQVIGPIIRTVLREGLSYVIYLYVAILLEYKDHLGPLSGDDDELDMKLQRIAFFLDRSNFAKLDRRAKQLRSRYPLQYLPSWPQLSPYSVLKTGKILKHSSAVYSLEHLDDSSNGRLSILRYSQFFGRARVSVTAMVAVALGATMVGLLWSRNRR